MGYADGQMHDGESNDAPNEQAASCVAGLPPPTHQMILTLICTGTGRNDMVKCAQQRGRFVFTNVIMKRGAWWLWWKKALKITAISRMDLRRARVDKSTLPCDLRLLPSSTSDTQHNPYNVYKTKHAGTTRRGMRKSFTATQGGSLCVSSRSSSQTSSLLAT